MYTITVIETLAAANALLDAATTHVEIDTETTGLSWATGDKPFLAAFCTSEDATWACYNPAMVRHILQGLEARGVTAVFHNARFDLHMLRVWPGCGWIPAGGYAMLRLDDTMHAARIQRPGESAKLKDLGANIVDVSAQDQQAKVLAWIQAHTTMKRVAGQKVVVQPNYADVPQDLMIPYAVQDVWLTRMIRLALEREREMTKREDRHAHLPTLEAVYRTEIELLKIVVEIERAGMPVDIAALTARLAAGVAAHKAASSAWETLAPGVSPTSNQQVANYFYYRLGEQFIHVTDSGAPSVDTVALRDFANRDAADALLELRGWTKHNERLSEMRALVTPEGRVHPTLRSDGAKTGRFSCSEPALQNLPRPNPDKPYTLLRDIFRPAPGAELLFVDFSQIELRLAAHYMQDEAWIRAFAEGVDLHALTAARMYGVALEKVNKTQRSFAKTINFMVLYGGGKNRLVHALRYGAAGSDPLSLAEAQAALKAFGETPAEDTADAIFEGLATSMLRAYHAENPNVSEFTRKAARAARTYGGITTGFGLRVPVPPEKAYIAGNAVIQGTAAGLLKETIIRVDKALADYCFAHDLCYWRDVKIIMSIHDELILELPVGHAQEVAAAIAGPMTTWPQFRVPIEVEFAYVAPGESWAQKRALPA